MDLSGEPVFAPGHPQWSIMTRPRRPRRRPTESPVLPQTWEDRICTPPAAGYIRLLDPPPPPPSTNVEELWYADKTLTEWHQLLASNNEQDKAVFYANQRKRWLARIVIQRWCQRVWRRRTQCNVDLIDMQPIPDRDAVFLTDIATRTVYRFHSRDLFSNLISNICLADEMLPSPRVPTNPYTNSPLTLAQTISVCQQLVQDYARRSRCPPVLLAAFWAARFDVVRFEKENASLLAQHAVMAYFKDIHEDNRDSVCDTMFQLLTENNLSFSPVAVRRWLRASPLTPLHREWLELVRDYTLYINLHVQIRPSWYTQDMIDIDVRLLYGRTTIPDPVSRRMSLLRSPSVALVQDTLLQGSLPQAALPQGAALPAALPMLGLLGLPMLPFDLSGGEMDYNLAIQLIQQALFRL